MIYELKLIFVRLARIHTSQVIFVNWNKQVHRKQSVSAVEQIIRIIIQRTIQTYSVSKQTIIEILIPIGVLFIYNGSEMSRQKLDEILDFAVTLLVIGGGFDFFDAKFFA